MNEHHIRVQINEQLLYNSDEQAGIQPIWPICKCIVHIGTATYNSDELSEAGILLDIMYTS